LGPGRGLGGIEGDNRMNTPLTYKDKFPLPNGRGNLSC
jgi:hypothetical protein